ncbi:MAG: V-type ATPase subunit [Treponemataceae bacterium]
MSDYDYLNARVRAMAGSLISNELLDQISRAEGEDIFIDLLMDSAYAQALTEVLESSHESDAAESALRRNLFSCLDKLRSIAPPGPLRLIDIQLNRWDLANIITIIRGKRRSASAEDIISALVPAGQFHPKQLASLAAETDEIAVADALATWGYQFASVLRQAIRASVSDPSLAALERCLYGEYFAWALSVLDPRESDEAILRGHLAMQIDLANILVLLKGADNRSRGVRAAPSAMIPGGSLGNLALENLGKAPDVERALELLDLTSFAPAVERGVLSYGRDKRLGVIERFLEAVVIEAGIRLFRRDPLSAGVPLGYLWKKVSEYLNLRILLRGKRYRMPANAVREELILA